MQCRHAPQAEPSHAIATRSPMRRPGYRLKPRPTGPFGVFVRDLSGRRPDHEVLPAIGWQGEAPGEAGLHVQYQLRSPPLLVEGGVDVEGAAVDLAEQHVMLVVDQ